LDEDSIPKQFKKLEDRVEQLVQTSQDLKHAKLELEAKIRELEEGLRTKDATQQSYMEEKSIIRSRIDNVLGRLDEVLDST
jgi:peptidoglycan hydrolase CwlO-like protein